MLKYTDTYKVYFCKRIKYFQLALADGRRAQNQQYLNYTLTGLKVGISAHLCRIQHLSECQNDKFVTFLRKVSPTHNKTRC